MEGPGDNNEAGVIEQPANPPCEPISKLIDVRSCYRHVGSGARCPGNHNGPGF